MVRRKRAEEELGTTTVKVRVLKAKGDKAPPDLPSQQVEPDKFENVYGDVGLVKPPYSFEQLSILAEKHPVHGASVEQKAADILGRGPHWESKEAVADPNEEQREKLRGWLSGLERDATLGEMLNAMLQDYETFGWGILEVLRDVSGKARALVHVPAQTVRAHIDRRRLVQIVGIKRVWFRRWGAYGKEDLPILAANGNRAPKGTSVERLANDMLVFKKPSRRSAVYGVPGYVSAIGHIAMSLAARDYNIAFFGNAREPRYMVIAEGTDEENVDATLDVLEEELSTQHGQPHRNLLIGTVGNTKIRIEKLTAVGNDEHFTRLTDTADGKILIAHRMPADRLGAVTRGTLGGSITKEISQVYRDAVITPSQHLTADRLSRFAEVESEEEELDWRLQFDPLDLSDESEDVKTTVELLKADAITLNEGRERLGYGPRDDCDVTLSVYLKEHGAPPSAPVENRASDRVAGAVHERLDVIDSMLLEHRAAQALHEEEEPHGDSEPLLEAVGERLDELEKPE
ncbi:hypothetical protein LCGC14_0445930 [marine sediment metagenome]|uniref:Phage portal protein n=1 Tax=marine sediment metagenome TaxID=412755 RepID=A0A0F9V5Y1_9ZZZZ